MTQNEKPVLSVESLSVEIIGSSDRPHAARNIDLQVNGGEIVCIVGESGSGKSVTSLAVMGLLQKNALQISSGTIHLDGERIDNLPDTHLRTLRGRRMAMIFQEPMTALNPVWTVGRQLEEVLEEHAQFSKPERRAKVRELLEEVNLSEVDRIASSYPHQLSGGQRQRVMIAMALAFDPALLIADEPTTALDVTTQAQVLKLIAGLQEKHGTGVLFITHDFSVVVEIADRVIVMKEGEIVEQGDVANVLASPQHDYTKKLLAAVPGATPPERKPLKTDAALSVEDLRIVYERRSGLFSKDRNVAVKNVSFDLKRGETLGIVGESGSGKSTIARAIVRLVQPESGSVSVDGQKFDHGDVSTLEALRRNVQIVFQDPYRSLNPRRTIGQSIVEGPMNFGKDSTSTWARARELMPLVGLEPKALDRYPHQFSGGQRQRVCIARALAMEPKVLIADEAVSALDVSVQAQVLELLEDITRRLGLATLFITHDLRVAAQICDRIAVMKMGEMVEIGSTLQVFSKPKDQYTQDLLAAAPGGDFERYLGQEPAMSSTTS